MTTAAFPNLSRRWANSSWCQYLKNNRDELKEKKVEIWKVETHKQKPRYETPSITCAVFISSNVENVIKELMDTKKVH